MKYLISKKSTSLFIILIYILNFMNYTLASSKVLEDDLQKLSPSSLSRVFKLPEDPQTSTLLFGLSEDIVTLHIADRLEKNDFLRFALTCQKALRICSDKTLLPCRHVDSLLEKVIHEDYEKFRYRLPRYISLKDDLIRRLWDIVNTHVQHNTFKADLSIQFQKNWDLHYKGLHLLTLLKDETASNKIIETMGTKERALVTYHVGLRAGENNEEVKLFWLTQVAYFDKEKRDVLINHYLNNAQTKNAKYWQGFCLAPRVEKYIFPTLEEPDEPAAEDEL